MRSYRQRSRAGWSSVDMMQRMFMKSAWPRRATWERAAQLGAVVVTKDEDFVTLRLTRRDGPAVLWIRLGNTRRAKLLTAMEALMPQLMAALERGETLVEVA